jgi:hypothetical protein
MENLPFLSQNPEPSSRSVQPPPPEHEPRVRAWTPQQDFEEAVPPRRFVPAFEQTRQQNIFDSLKDNHVALILIGIVIGVLIMNMRPIIVNPMK